MPRGARQGPDVWYTVGLHYRITFAADSGPGFAWVMADTNGRTSAQIEYTVRRAGRTLRVRETSVDIVNGQLEKTFHGRTSEVRFRNYLQIAGVRGGDNELRLRIEQSDGARIERVEVFGDSGVFRTADSPYPLRIVPRVVSEGAIHPGTTFRVVVAVSNRTGEPLRDVAVRPTFDARGLRLLSPRVRRYGSITRPAEAAFVFQARELGRHRIDVLGDSSRNHPSAALAVTVAPEPASRTLEIAAWGAALLPIVLVGAWLARSRRGGR